MHVRSEHANLRVAFMGHRPCCLRPGLVRQLREAPDVSIKLQDPVLCEGFLRLAQTSWTTIASADLSRFCSAALRVCGLACGKRRFADSLQTDLGPRCHRQIQNQLAAIGRCDCVLDVGRVGLRCVEVVEVAFAPNVAECC